MMHTDHQGADVKRRSCSATPTLTLWDPLGDVGEPVLAQSPQALQARPRGPTCQRDPAHSAGALRAMAQPQVWPAREGPTTGWLQGVAGPSCPVPPRWPPSNYLSKCTNPCTGLLVILINGEDSRADEVIAEPYFNLVEL
uniref:Uncharacterized protein n=1 Tax=Myotis myotis TaxID=51298 RepID=A0A7J7Z595_MYOMY|nr:hypothetical protein mMyoMyo1_010656 [Myotis myotis]